MPVDDKQKSVRTGLEDPSVIKEIHIQPANIENIDFALYDYIDGLNIFTTTNKGWKETPVIWVTPERAFQIKHNKDFRNIEGVFTLPAITIERSSITKDLSRKGGIFGNALTNERGGAITIARRINQEKTQKFANADSYRLNKQDNFPTIGAGNKVSKNKKVVYQTYTIPAPTYIELLYSVTLRAEYQQQINEMIEPFIRIGSHINYATLTRNNHRYEAFVQQDFSVENNISNLEEGERKYETKVDIKVLGYIIGTGKNQEGSKIIVKENFVDVKIGRERVVMGDIPGTTQNLESDKQFRD